MKDPVGIVGYGAYIPRYRIKTSEVARAWGWDAEAYRKGLGMEEKSVAARDQDCITLAVEAARRAIRRGATDPAKIGAIYIGSESHPYAVKPSGTVVSEAIGTDPLDPHRRPGVRLQGGHRGDVPVRAPGRGGRRRVRPGDRLRHRAGRAGRPARVRHRRRRRGVHLRARRRRGHDGRVDLLHDGHARLLAPRGGAVPAARRALHRRAGLFPSHDDGGAETARADRPEGRRLRARDLPSAERQVPGARGTTARVLEGAMPRGAAVAAHRQRVQRRVAARALRRARRGEAGAENLHGLLRIGRGQRRRSSSRSPTGSTRSAAAGRRSRRFCRSRPCSSITRATRGSAARSRAKRIDRRFRYRNVERRTMRDVAIIGDRDDAVRRAVGEIAARPDGRGGAQGDRRRGRGPRGLDVRRLHVERPVRRAGAPGEPGLGLPRAWGRSRRRASSRPALRADWRCGRPSSRSPAA